MPSLRCTSCGMRFRRGTSAETMLAHLLSCSADVRGHQNAKTSNNSIGSRSSSRNSREKDDDSSCNSSMLDRKPPAKRSSELSEDTTTTGEGDAAAVGLLALKSFPSNGSISSSALLSRRPTTGAAASATAASARKGEPEDDDEEGIQDAHQTQQHDLRHTSIDSRYECPCCQHEFFTTQTSWEEIQLHVTSCVDLNESIDSAKIMASALVTMKSSPEIPDDLHRASRKRKLAPKAAAAAAAATEAAFADNRVEGKKRAPKRVAANAKAVKSSRTYLARKKKPPRPSKRRDRGGSIAAAASEKRRRAQDVASLSSGPMQQTLSEMVMGYLDMLY